MSIEKLMATAAAGAAMTVLPRNRLAILTYHRVLDKPDPLLPSEPDAVAFDAHMQIIRRHFVPLALRDALKQLRSGSLPRGAVAITFDDGYADNYRVALPILKKWKIPAICYVASDYMDGGRMFNDTVIEAVRSAASSSIDLECIGLGAMSIGNDAEKRAAINAILDAIKYLPMHERRAAADRVAKVSGANLRNDQMMSVTEVRGLADGGVEIGSHTCSHPILSAVSETEAVREINQSRARLQSAIDRPVMAFAYPNGRSGRDFLPPHVEVVRNAGYDSAVTTDWGCATAVNRPFELPRLAVSGYRGDWLGLRLAKYFFETSPAQPVETM